MLSIKLAVYWALCESDGVFEFLSWCQSDIMVDSMDATSVVDVKCAEIKYLLNSYYIIAICNQNIIQANVIALYNYTVCIF